VLCGQPFSVLVDYAHTPDALQAALAAARALAGPHRVFVVFGAGGDRDAGKRPMMGRVAAIGADQVIITSDNPRSEDPDAIIDEIETGIPSGTTAQIEREVDRQAAIEQTLARARPGDCVLIAGKGHETEQVFADRVIEFDDAAVAAEWLESNFAAAHDEPESAS
jgi:UDP-N-acetylmuramoyl-L-alanyl-D-glutamate--2,6-diaminopimelate ligase